MTGVGGSIVLLTGTYENGIVRLNESVRFKHDRFSVVVHIPDSAFVDHPEDESPESLHPISDPVIEALVRDLRAIREAPIAPPTSPTASSTTTD